ncbi:hypothetical protein RRG08_009410 [Elysia crispata]|uniref:Uncharacterized protein n=1 Tax=Elysia crispata TaxID=231223 RepID=A0AAE0Y8G6_9GAST|nr:hypothetical protein RRG08_009410 [Elysia crispata]
MRVKIEKSKTRDLMRKISERGSKGLTTLQCGYRMLYLQRPRTRDKKEGTSEENDGKHDSCESTPLCTEQPWRLHPVYRFDPSPWPEDPASGATVPHWRFSVGKHRITERTPSTVLELISWTSRRCRRAAATAITLALKTNLVGFLILSRRGSHCLRFSSWPTPDSPREGKGDDFSPHCIVSCRICANVPCSPQARH